MKLFFKTQPLFSLENVKLLTYLFICCLLVVFISCEKQTNNYNSNININPPAGNYYSTLFCKINDSDWCDCTVGMSLRGWKSSGVDAMYYTNMGGQPFEIQANNACESYSQALLIYIIPFQGLGKYYLNKKGFGSYAVGSYWSGKPSDLTRIYYTNFDYNGIVEITEFDTIKRVVSGSFYFDALYTDSNQVAKITNGKLVKIRYN